METIHSLCAETRVIPISAPEKENRGHTSLMDTHAKYATKTSAHRAQ